MRSAATQAGTAPRSKAAIWLRKALWAAGIIFVAAAIWCGVLYAKIVRFDGVPAGNMPVRADVGIVLGATLWNDKPSPGLQERLDQALRLYKEGLFDRLIVTGGLDHNGSSLTEAEGMRNYLVTKGVPGSSIALDRTSRSTYENLTNAKAIMEKQGWTSAIIVTHRYHGSRAADIARSIGYEKPQVSVTDSKVLKLSYHKKREVLAYTKWYLDKARRKF